jgi:hypothetical protein
MAGRDYYQMVLAHKLVEDAIYAKLCEAFDDWLLAENVNISYISDLSSALSCF